MPELKLRECVDGSGTNRYTRGSRLDCQSEVMDGGHPNRTARIDRNRRARIPDFAVNKDLSIGPKQSLSHPDFTNEAPFSGHYFVSPRTHGNVDEEHGY